MASDPQPLGRGMIGGVACCLAMIVAAAAPSGRAASVEPVEIARRIDEHVLGAHVALVDDTAFLRRVTLDLTGRIPTVAEVHDYLAEDSRSRSATAINRLLHAGVHTRNMATFFRRTWVPQADTREFAGVADPFEAWLTGRLRDGARYHELVAEILTQDPTGAQSGSAGPWGFFEANQGKPENLAASAARGFLGLNLDCAQCHDHPHARWTREQFWQTAAFFADVPPGAGPARPGLPKIKIPETDRECEPVFLTAAAVAVPAAPDSRALRQAFVAWMLEDGERLMAKNAVNRLWSHFFGEAVVEPMDDLSREEFQTGERAALLDELADLFIATGYDVHVLVEGMVSSRAYRLAPTASTPGRDSTPATPTNGPAEATVSVTADTARFMLTGKPVRGLTGEQLYDSLRVAAGLPMARSDVGLADGRSQRDAFTAEFYVERPHGAERSITQALTLMNGPLVNDLTTAEGNRILASLLAAPFVAPDDQIDTVFLAVLGRHPTSDELDTVRRRFAGSPELGPADRLGSLFWALVNSFEFCTNH